VYDTGDRIEEERGTLQVIASQVDAVVGYLSQPEDEIDKLARGLPVVLIDREHRTERFSSIRIDGEKGVRAAIAHLVESGHRHIGMLDHAGRSEPSIRHAWFADAMAACGLDAGPVSRADQSVEGGESALKDLLAEHPDVTAVFAFNDIVAIGALPERAGLGREVPRDPRGDRLRRPPTGGARRAAAVHRGPGHAGARRSRRGTDGAAADRRGSARP
jgi:Transcriptional regulators